jgi:hypothetical protein
MVKRAVRTLCRWYGTMVILGAEFIFAQFIILYNKNFKS